MKGPIDLKDDSILVMACTWQHTLDAIEKSNTGKERHDAGHSIDHFLIAAEKPAPLMAKQEKCAWDYYCLESRKAYNSNHSLFCWLTTACSELICNPCTALHK